MNQSLLIRTSAAPGFLTLILACLLSLLAPAVHAQQPTPPTTPAKPAAADKKPTPAAKPTPDPAAAKQHRPMRLLVAASQQNLWIARVEENLRFSLQHYRDNQEPPRKEGLQDVFRIMSGGESTLRTGLPIAVAAWADSLYILYSDNTVQSILWTRRASRIRDGYEDAMLMPLPRGARVQSWIALQGGPAALIQLFQEPDAPQPNPATPPAPAKPDLPAKPGDPTSSLKRTIENLAGLAGLSGEYRLLVMRQGRWETTALPENLTLRGEDRLATVSGQGGILALLSADREDPLKIVRHELDGGQWNRRILDLRLSTDLQPLGLDDDLVLARRESGPPDRFQAWLSRGDQLLPVGPTEHHEKAMLRWWAIPFASGKISYLWQTEQGKILWMHQALGDSGKPGDATEPAELLPVDTSESIINFATITIIVMIGAAMAVFLAVMRRDPLANPAVLPPELAPASTIRRFLAWLIDMIPGWAVVPLLFDPSDLQVMFESVSLTEMQDPIILKISLTAWAIHAAYTALFEMFAGTTPGKGLFGLRVISQTGGPPNIWQILGRNGFKIIEISIWPMLILIWITPTRQRLGDLASGTIVVMKRAAEPVNPGE